MKYLVMLLLLLVGCGASVVQGPPGPQGEPGAAGAQGSAGTNGTNGSNGVVATIDPCGDDIGYPDEVLLRLSSTVVIAYFRSGSYEHLVQLTLGGGYSTTDHQSCSFTVQLNGQITDSVGGTY